MKWKKCEVCGEDMLSDFENCTKCWVKKGFKKSEGE